MRRNTRSATFRIENRTFDHLSSEAEKKKISLNTLVNQILQEYMDWHAHARMAGQVPIAKGLITTLMDKFTDEEVVRLADESIKYPKEIIMFLKTEYNVKSALEVFESWLMATGFPYTIDVRDNEYKIAIQHDMGRKWSLYLAEVARGVYESLGAKIRAEIMDNTLVLKISNI